MMNELEAIRVLLELGADLEAIVIRGALLDMAALRGQGEYDMNFVGEMKWTMRKIWVPVLSIYEQHPKVCICVFTSLSAAVIFRVLHQRALGGALP